MLHAVKREATKLFSYISLCSSLRGGRFTVHSVVWVSYVRFCCCYLC